MSTVPEDRIKSMLKQPPAEGYVSAWEALRGIVRPVDEALESDRLRMTIEPGHLLSVGQQFNIITEIPHRGLRDVLFRAYIPANGWPMSLDLFDDDFMTCTDEQELGEAIAGFIELPEVRQRLLTLRDWAQSP